MKRINYLLLLIITVSAILTSCEKEPGSKKGKVEFNASIKNELKSLKSADSTSTISYALIEIQNAAGEVVLSNEKISLTQFGESHLSDPIALTTGSYKLTKFLLVNNENVVVYAAPLEGSDKAYLVQNPLPIEFEVNEDIVTKVSPEVIDAIGQTPQDFGYTTFSFNVVETFDFLITAFVYNDSIQNFQLTDAHLQVTASNAVVYDGNLSNITNQITVREIESDYQLVVSKDSYQTVIKSMTKAELVASFTNPLEIILSKDSIDLSKGLIGFYPFNNNVLDYSNSQNNGIDYTLGNYVEGVNGNALDFNGSTDYIELTNTLDATHGLSFSFWINSRGTNGSENNGAVIAKYDMSGSRSFHISSYFWYYNVRNRIEISYYSDPSTSALRDWVYSDQKTEDYAHWPNPQTWSLVNPTQLTLGNWTHVVVNCSDTVLSVWLDGVLTVKKTREFSTYYNSEYEPTYIGNIFNGGQGSNNHLNGTLDELRIYNRGLSEAEIQYLYLSRK